MPYEIKIVPRSEREALIKKRLDASSETEVLFDFRGEKTPLRVISLGVDVPVHRMENCRAFTEQQELIAAKELEGDHFTKGQELSTVQSDQHRILLKLAKRGTASVSPIIDVLRKEGQRETILISSTGVVVNGNRRLSAIRELYVEDDSVNSKFGHVRCRVLPPDTTPDEIDDIEANLQARPHTKLDYDWIGDAQLVRRQVNKDRTTKQVADQLRRSDSAIKNLLQALDEADLYLREWAQKPGRYRLVSGDAEQFFGDLPKRMAGKDIALQNASRAIAYSLFDNREKLPGRIYTFNAAFGKLASDVLKNVAEQLDLSLEPTDDDEEGDDFSIEIDERESQFDYSVIIDALRDDESKDEAVDALIDASQSAIEKEKGQKSQNAALRAISQAHSKLAGVDVTTAGAETYRAIERQLESIELILTKLRQKLVALKSGNGNADRPGE